MSELFAFADDYGPAKVVAIHHPKASLKAILVVDNVAAGPAIGGARMAVDVTYEECFRLARAMTWKNAAAGLPHGGAKAVIFADPTMPEADKERTMRAFARAIEPIADYVPGPDMGTNEACMAWVTDEIGRAVGLPRVIGGIPLDEIGATGFGLATAAEAVAATGRIMLDGARVVVQGYGAVGRHAARFLDERGAQLVAVSDSRGAIRHDDGLDLDALDTLKADGRSVADLDHGVAISADDLIGVPCDIWIPAARPDVLSGANVDRLDTKLFLQGANIPATLDAEQRLHERGILSVPDFIANAGGVICGAVEFRGGSERAAFDVIAQSIGRNTKEVLERSLTDNAPPRTAALAMAGERVRTAMRFRQ